ncbi:MAG: DUF2911 domain-containing protein [Bacteroidetes bacterium]|nr:DUF2911 domain-containing protein [Bacteroidota bacterium]
MAAYGQESFKSRPSPVAIASARYKDSYVKIVYGQPQKRGRLIFGGLVPFGQVWRTGANEATELTATRDIRINGFDLKAGTYTLFTIPGPDQWTIIVNSELGQWGSYNHNPKLDILRFDVPVHGLGDAEYEALTIWTEPKLDQAEIHIAWERTMVTLQVQFTEPKQ